MTVEEMFFEYNMRKNGDIENVMKYGLIILDTNVLLHPYRFSVDNRVKYFEILSSVKDRLFLTYQSVKEFYNNRPSVIHDKSKLKGKLIKELNKKIEQVINDLKNRKVTPENKKYCDLLIQYEETLFDDIIGLLNETKKNIENKINSCRVDIKESFINNSDPIIDKMFEIFKGKVNEPFDKNKLDEIYKMGKKRYAMNIPPGYKDAEDKTSEKGKSEPECYGDLVIWEEMIDIAKDKKKDVLFISDDTKEDWHEKIKGCDLDLGPRKELIREFFYESSQKFYSITTKNFIKYISELNNIKDIEGLEKEADSIDNELSNSYLGQNISSNIEELIKQSKLNTNVGSNVFAATMFALLEEMNKLEGNNSLGQVIKVIQNSDE